MKKVKQIKKNDLLLDVCRFIEQGRQQLAYAANAAITYTYWRVGNRINTDVLKNKRADYGKQIVVSLARQLTVQYGKSYEEKNLRRMMQFAQVFNDEQALPVKTKSSKQKKKLK